MHRMVMSPCERLIIKSSSRPGLTYRSCTLGLAPMRGCIKLNMDADVASGNAPMHKEEALLALGRGTVGPPRLRRRYRHSECRVQPHLGQHVGGFAHFG